MSDKCVSGRHNYEHLGTSCEDMDKQLRVAREVALRSGTSIESERGPVWSVDGEDNEVPAIPDGITATGEGVYASGFIGTAHGDDEQGA